MRHPRRSRRDSVGERGCGWGDLRGAINFSAQFCAALLWQQCARIFERVRIFLPVVILTQNGCFTRTFRTRFHGSVIHHCVTDLQQLCIHLEWLPPLRGTDDTFYENRLKKKRPSMCTFKSVFEGVKFSTQTNSDDREDKAMADS